MLPACQRYCDHYVLGVEHGRQGFTLEQARTITSWGIVGDRSCTCYLDGLSDGRDGTTDPSGKYGGRCDCNNWTIKVKVTRTL